MTEQERTAREAIESAGYKYLGQQQRVNKPPIYLFNDETGSTLSLEEDEVTTEGIQAKVAASREARGLAPLDDATDEAVCADIDLVLGAVTDLTPYQAQVFIELTDYSAVHDGVFFGWPESVALEAIKQHAKLIEDRQRRHFLPYATAKAIAEIHKAPNALKDTARLDWLERQATGYGNGWLARPSTTGRGYRLTETSRPDARSTVREAIDEAMKEGI